MIMIFFLSLSLAGWNTAYKCESVDIVSLFIISYQSVLIIEYTIIKCIWYHLLQNICFFNFFYIPTRLKNDATLILRKK